MIWHIAEIWLLLVLAYVGGNIAGVLFYEGVARSPLASAQGAVADWIGDSLDAIKATLGIAPSWRPEIGRAPSRALEQQIDEGRIAAPDRYVDPWPAGADEAGLAGTAPPEQSETGWRDAEPEVDWDGAPVWEDEGEVAAVAPRTTEAPAAPVPKVELPSMRPVGLGSPRNGVPDDLQRIRGVGQKNEEMLNGFGIFHFGQIAAWTPAEARWVGAFLAFPERIERDDWIGQATVLASGGSTGYVKAADRRRARDE